MHGELVKVTTIVTERSDKGKYSVTLQSTSGADIK